jgi:uncharacterized protein (DUF885 family)
MTSHRTRLLLAVALLSLAISGCAKTPEAAPPQPVAEAAPPVAPVPRPWAAFTHRFLEDYFLLNPAFAVYQGRHEYDGVFADLSPAGLKARGDFLKGAITQAQAMDPSTLTADERFERDYLIHVARKDLFWLEDADAPHRNVTWYFDNGLDPNVYIARPYADAETRMRAFIKYARGIPAAVAQIRANLNTPMPISFVNYGIPGFRGFADYYTTDAKAAFASVKDVALQTEFDAAAKDASAAMNGMAAWLESQRKTATTGFALGANRFARMLSATEGVDVSLDELEAVGRADLKRNQAALKTECAAYSPGTSLGACMDKMNSKKSDKGPVAEAREQLPMLRQFILDHDIVSIPGTEQAQVEESPPYNRQNSAYIDIPGPYEKGLPSVYYISPPDPSWDAKTRDAYVPGSKDLLFTSTHEVWPGHFLNFLHANRSKSIFGRVFVGYAFAEGWAHYTEEMMWDAGLGAGDRETHIGQLSNALLRDCRYLSAIGMHARGMTQDQSRQMFIKECYQDEGNARQQSARGTYDPAYLNYTMGKLMIRKLRDDWTGGDRTKWKAFHDTFLGFGGPPIPMVRGAMMGAEAKAAF